MYSVFRFIGRILFISLFFPITLIAQKAAGTTQPYRVKAGETMLGIANRHGTTLSHLLQLNPGMKPDYVQNDQVIRVPATAPTPQATKPQAGAAKAQAGSVKAQAGATKAQAGAAKAQAGAAKAQPGAAKAQPVAARQVKQQPIIQYKEHKVKRKETLYSIARTYDITVDELLQANPQVEKVDGKLKKGTILRIPVKIIPPQPAYVGLDTIRVAVVLPLSGKGVENERSVMVGQVNETRRRAYDAMLRARQQVFDRLRPGTIFEDLYFAAMKEFEDAGFGSILPGRCGHGMGLSTHEFPSVTKGNKAPLAPGMVLTVEPGLMSAELGAVRNSDTVLITEDGFEFLTHSKRDEIIIKG